MARNFTVDTWDDPPEDETVKIQKVDEILSLKKITKTFKTNAMTMSDIESLKKEFNKFDKKKNGLIKSSNVLTVFLLAGQNADSTVQEQIREKANNTGTELSFQDTMKIFKKFWKSHDQYKRQLREALEVFEVENDDELVDYKDMKHALLRLGDKFTQEELEEFEETFEKLIINDQQSGKELISMKDIMNTVLVPEKKKDLFKSRRLSRKKSIQNLKKKLQLKEEINLESSELNNK